jgi:hypothetical protein
MLHKAIRMVNKNTVRAPSDVTMCSARLSVTLASRNIHLYLN